MVPCLIYRLVCTESSPDCSHRSGTHVHSLWRQQDDSSAYLIRRIHPLILFCVRRPFCLQVSWGAAQSASVLLHCSSHHFFLGYQFSLEVGKLFFKTLEQQQQQQQQNVILFPRENGTACYFLVPLVMSRPCVIFWNDRHFFSLREQPQVWPLEGHIYAKYM